MKLALLAAVAAIGLTTSASAVQIISFGQDSPTNTITATANLLGTQTTIATNGTGAAVLIDQLDGAITPPAIPGFMTLSATSIDNATPVGPAFLQHYSGSFCISAAASCGGIIDLKGTFSDAAFGLGGGTQLSVNVASPPDTLSLSSDVIPAADLVPPSSFTLSMSNLSALALDNLTLASFTASFSGVANASPVPEPGGLALLGFGILGLGLVRHRHG